MPSIERSDSRDSERHLKHQHSASSDCSRAIVPMWDSSDPDRAPPPLPMNPSSPSIATSRPNTSTAIQSAHAALTEKARESAYVTNPPPKRIDTSPERSLIRGAAHKRMQSLHTGNVRDLSSFLEGGSTFGSPKSPEKIGNRPPTPHSNKDFFLEGPPEKSPEKSPEKDPIRSTTPTNGRETPIRELSAVRPSLRRPPQSILGENTPPQSATMLALQTMASKDLDTPLSNVTNGSTALVRTPQTFDAISNQILSLTSIATSLQREMAQLSRRSKDNATDLVSLKEATNARDEDIRKSLRELVSNLSESGSRTSSAIYGGPGALYLESKAHNSPGSRAIKPFSLPRIPSPNSFAASLDRDSIASPCPFSPDGAASIALLEKILREMGTKEGQENLVARLTEVGDRLTRDGMSTAKKIEELLQFIKSNNSVQDIVLTDGGGPGGTRPRNFSFENPPRLELDFESKAGPIAQRVEALLGPGSNKENQRSPSSARGSDLLNDDVLKLIRTIKDSVAQGGGLTAEVKALVRELRGEVLGMGREIGRKLDEASSKNESEAKDATAEKEEMADIIQSGLEKLQLHIDEVIRENQRQSVASLVTRNPVDYQEIYNAMRAAINEKPRESRPPDLGKEDIVEAVREAWENYKPDIEVQQFGLEREELLACLKEGIQQYVPQDKPRGPEGATRDEVFTAVVEGLKHFVPPRIEAEPSLSRDEILDAVRECLEEFEFPAAPPLEPKEPEITRDDMVDAVREGLHTFDFPIAPPQAPKEPEITRDDMVDAVREGLHTFDFAANTTALSRDIGPSVTRDDMLDAVKEGLHTFDFPSMSSTRNIDEVLSRDDVLDAIKDGFSVADFMASSTALSRSVVSGGVTRDDMLDAVKEGLHSFDFPTASVAREMDGGLSREEVLDAVNEGLHTFDFPTSTVTRDDVLDAVKEGLSVADFTANSTALSRDVISGGVTRDDMLDAIKEGLHTFDFPTSAVTRDDVLDAIKEGLSVADFTANSTALSRDVISGGVTRDDMLDAIKEGLHTFDFPTSAVTRDDVLDAIKEGLSVADFTANSTALSRDVIGSGVTRDDMLDAVREGLHSFDFPTAGAAQEMDSGLSREEVLDAVNEGLHTFDFPTSTVTRDDVLDAIKEGFSAADFAANSTALSRDVVSGGVTRDDMFDAIKEGLHTFDFPSSAVTRDDMLDAIKEGLHTFDFPTSTVTRDDVLDAIKEGLSVADFTANSTALSRDVVSGGVTRDDMFDAIKEGLHTFDFPTSAATRDDMLDAIKEGLHTFDFPTSAVTRDDMLDAIKEGLHSFDFPTTSVAQEMDSGLSREEVLDAVNEGLHTFDFPTSTVTRDDMLDAIKEGLYTFDFPDNSTSPEAIITAVREGLKDFDFAASSTALTRDVGGQGESLTHDDVLEAVKEGLQGVDFSSNAPTRDEMFDVVSEALRNFDFAANTTALSREVSGAVTRDDMLEAVKEGLHSFDFNANTTALTRDIGPALTRDDVYDAVKAGFEEAPTNNDALGEQVLERLQEIMEGMHAEFKAVSDEAKQNVSAHGRDTEQVLDATKDGFEKLRADIESYVERVTDGSAKEEFMDSMRENFDNLRADVEVLLAKKSDSSLEAVQGELEHLRETMATSLVRGGAAFDKDEFLDALRDGLDGIRADLDRPRDSNESILSGTGEILDALHDGMTGLRGDVEKLHNKPVDMTVNYEILDTLKAGLEGLRADIDRLRENGYGEENAIAETNSRAIIAAQAADGLKRNDIENLEILITQLRIKVEALESMPPPPAEPSPGSLRKEDLESVEEKLVNVQESVAGMLNREEPVDEDKVKREDFEAIETLLRNTKAKIDEIDPEQTVKKEHLDAVEALLFETRENVTELKNHLEDVTKRDDIMMVEGLLRGVVEGLDEMKERAKSEEEDVEKVTKTDVEAVEAVCIDIKTAIEQRVLSDLADVASKDDVKNLGQMVKEFNSRLDTHANTTSKAFEDRQAETVGVGERVTEIKSFLEEFREIIKEKLDEGHVSVETLGTVLEGISETIGQNANNSDDLKELLDTMKSEFEKSNAGVVGAKLEADEKFQTTWDKFDAKIDEKFNELMTKYDDAEIAADSRAKVAEEKNAEIETAMLGTKSVAEDLKLLVDTLGTTLTDSVEKMDEASKTVFNRVEETFTRVEETHADAKAEHQLTRDQVFKSIGVIEGVQGQVTEYHPKILDSIKDVLLIVGQHYEHSKTSVEALQEKIAERPPPPELPLLQEPPPEKYDDTPVHEKLDKLVDHMHAAGKSFAQLDMLDKIHQQVMQTAAEVSEFVTAQTKRITEDHEDKEKAAEAATIALEKRLAQKEHVEATVAGLREEEEQLKESVSILKAEQEDLAYQKMRLSADVSSLETALRIRREELHAMEARAEGLERRILEGVIDHSRALLLSKGNKSGRDAMSRKRVPSHATSTTGSVISYATSRASATTQSAVGMAMNGNRALVSVPINNPAGASRRILSLNQITHNVPTGSMKRSQSVKAPGGAGVLRKSSWGGSLSQKYGDLNKENLALKETEEEDTSENDDYLESENLRRSSRGTTIITGTGTTMTESTIDEGTEWTGSMSGDGDDETEGGDEENGGPEEDHPAQVVLYEEGGQLVET